MSDIEVSGGVFIIDNQNYKEKEYINFDEAYHEFRATNESVYDKDLITHDVRGVGVFLRATYDLLKVVMKQQEEIKQLQQQMKESNEKHDFLHYQLQERFFNYTMRTR